MLQTLAIENYRGFKNYRVEDLSRVNLLVGKNNCGKTSLLECIELLATRGSAKAFIRAARERDEVLEIPGQQPGSTLTWATIAHFFLDHRFGPNSSLAIDSQGALGKLSVNVSSFTARDERFSLATPQGVIRPTLQVTCVVYRPDHEREKSSFLAFGDGVILEVSSATDAFPQGAFSAGNHENVQFMNSHSPQAANLYAMWDRLNLEKREKDAVAALQVLEPQVTDIFFRSVSAASRLAGHAAIYAALQDEDRRVPLGSYGEGMHRLLTLALCLAQAKGGVLLIDEIDTGLHYSVLPDVWVLVAEAAKKLDVSVFATTHSLDCVRGLARACETHPDLKPHVSLQKMDRRLDHSVALDAEQIIVASEQDIEVR